MVIYELDGVSLSQRALATILAIILTTLLYQLATLANSVASITYPTIFEALRKRSQRGIQESYHSFNTCFRFSFSLR